jgi:3D (Asp-Asp-Asp) domain-containing protein
MLSIKIRIARLKLAIQKTIKEAKRIARVLSLVILGGIIGTSYTIAGQEIAKIAPELTGSRTVEYSQPFHIEASQASPAPTEDANQGDESAWQVGEATAYNSGDQFTPGTVMANGETVHAGAIACPSRYAFGQRIEIKGQGVYTCADRMAKRFRDGNYFDIYKEDIQAAHAFGRQSVEFRAL